MKKTALLTVDRLQVVFKIVERCNINCSYCYYFNMGDTSALAHPATVSVESAAQIANWLAIGCRELQTKELLISFHGGEPMMLKPERFDSICQSFADVLAQTVDVYFSIQTNGTIWNDAWLSALRKHRVNVGISIDGGQAAHDRHRLDHRGRTTFSRTERTLKSLIQSAESTSDLTPSTISVLDYRNDYTEIYGYLRGLGVRRMSFLLPDRSFDERFDGEGESAVHYGDALFQIFEAWMTEDDPDIEVRFISEFLQHFRPSARRPSREGHQPRPETSPDRRWTRQVLIVHSDGLVTVSDSYIPALSWYRGTPQCRIHETSLLDFLGNGIFDEIERATASLPHQCQKCEWRRFCRGGDLENRFSKENGFDNPSVYCDGYKLFFDKACKSLVDNGYPESCVESLTSIKPPSSSIA